MTAIVMSNSVSVNDQNDFVAGRPKAIKISLTQTFQTRVANAIAANIATMINAVTTMSEVCGDNIDAL
jgi:hypothetical protein